MSSFETVSMLDAFAIAILFDVELVVVETFL